MTIQATMSFVSKPLPPQSVTTAFDAPQEATANTKEATPEKLGNIFENILSKNLVFAQEIIQIFIGFFTRTTSPADSVVSETADSVVSEVVDNVVSAAADNAVSETEKSMDYSALSREEKNALMYEAIGKNDKEMVEALVTKEGVKVTDMYKSPNGSHAKTFFEHAQNAGIREVCDYMNQRINSGAEGHDLPKEILSSCAIKRGNPYQKKIWETPLHLEAALYTYNLA